MSRQSSGIPKGYSPQASSLRKCRASATKVIDLRALVCLGQSTPSRSGMSQKRLEATKVVRDIAKRQASL